MVITASDILQYIRDNQLPPIMARDVEPSDQFELFNNLKPLEPLIDHENAIYRIFDGRILESVVTMNGQDYAIIFRLGYKSYPLIDRITDFYQEEQRVKSYTTNRKLRIPNLSVHRLWYDYPEILEELIENSLQQLDNPFFEDLTTPEEVYHDYLFKFNLMSKLYHEGIYPSQYRVTWVVSIIAFFRQFITIEKMLDPFAGWGDRLIGAMKLDVAYHGFDPNLELQPGYNRIIEDLCDNERRDCYRVEGIGFEDGILDDDGYDLILTSPPFKDVEIYSDHPTQSIIKFADNWYHGFYLPSLKKAWESLRPSGLFILHVADTRTFQMVKKTMTFFARLSNCHHRGQFMTHTTKSDYPNLHLVYQKS